MKPEGCNDAKPDSRARQRHSLYQHEPNHRRALRAERHANADLARALLDIVRDDSIDSDDGEKKGDERECRHDLGSKAGARDRHGKKRLHGDDIGNRLILVDAQHGLAKSGNQATVDRRRCE